MRSAVRRGHRDLRAWPDGRALEPQLVCARAQL